MWGHRYLVHLHCGFFLFFLFSFLRAHKKHKNANKRISDLFPLRCFLSALFNFCSLVAFCAFACLRLCTFVLLVFSVLLVLLVILVRAKSFCKKNKEFKTALITSFTLLLGKGNLSAHVHTHSQTTSANWWSYRKNEISQRFYFIITLFILVCHELFLRLTCSGKTSNMGTTIKARLLWYFYDLFIYLLLYLCVFNDELTIL